MSQKSFNSSSGLTLDISGISNQIKNFIESAPSRSYKVIIGTDSEGIDDKNADFVTAIVVHREGRGGRYFWRRIKQDDCHNMRDRIIQEVMLSLEMGKEILSSLESELDFDNWDFEIHADVGSNGPTRELIQEVVGMIRANDFKPKTKPESYAASSVADRHV